MSEIDAVRVPYGTSLNHELQEILLAGVRGGNLQPQAGSTSRLVIPCILLIIRQYAYNNDFTRTAVVDIRFTVHNYATTLMILKRQF